MVPPKSSKSVLLWTRSPGSSGGKKKKKKILQFHQQLFIWRNYRTKAWSAAVVKERTLSPYGFLSSACIFPTAAWGHFPNGAWGQESIGTWKTLHECSISKVCPYSCLFLLQERHQQGFASLFFTMWICNPLDFLTISGTDHEAVLFKKINK